MAWRLIHVYRLNDILGDSGPGCAAGAVLKFVRVPRGAAECGCGCYGERELTASVDPGKVQTLPDDNNDAMV